MSRLIAIPKRNNVLARIQRGFSKLVFKESDGELPFAFMLITVMSSCGISPYESFRRLRSVKILPFIQKESSEIVRQVEVLNKDPLTAMLQRADESDSKIYGDSLRGYVSTVKSGGSVTSYLKSKLRSIFELQAEAAARSIGRLETLVEAYMVMLIVLLCTYIFVSVMSSITTFSMNLGLNFGGPNLVYAILFLFMPLMSILFMFFAHQTRRGTIIGLRSIYYKAFPPAIASAILLVLYIFVPQIKATIDVVGAPIFTTACLLAVSLLPMISYRRMIGLNVKTEESMPSFLRDISEARKTGMSPEKSIVHGATRKGYGAFSKVLQRMVTQIEWGVSLRKIYEDLKERVQSWPVLANFVILIETIEVGGGSSEALELLAGYSEKVRDIEKNKRDMLKPYVLLPFIWSALMSLTFTFTFYVITQIPASFGPQQPFASMGAQIGIFSSALILQCWLSGFFIGKVIQGTFAAGFEYSVLLAAVSLGSLLFSQRITSILIEALV